MAEFYKKNKFKIIFATFLFLLFFGGYWSIRYNLPKTLEIVLELALGPKLKSSNIIFEKNKIIIEDFSLISEGEEIISSPKVEILYSEQSLKNLRIEEIILNGGIANITRYKNGDINIVSAFTGGSEEKKEPEKVVEEKPYEAGIGVPIDKITGIGVTTVYRDLSYRLPIEQIAYDTNGYLTFSKTEGIDLHFIGKNGEEVYDYAFSNAKEPYSMKIKLSNIGVKTELAQYGYDGEEVSYEGGVLNMNLTIASSGLDGWIKFEGVDVRYKDLDSTIEDVKGGVEFNKEGIFLKANGKLFEKSQDFSLTYKDSELNIDFKLKNVQKENIEKLSYLNGIELPFKEMNIDSVNFNLNLKEELKVTIDTYAKTLLGIGFNLKNSRISFVYDKEGIHIKKLNSIFEKLGSDNEISLRENIDLSLDYWENTGKLNFNIENLEGKKYIPKFSGNLNFNVGEEELTFALDSNILDLKGRYLKEKNILQLDEKDRYFLEYDLGNKKLLNGAGNLEFEIFGMKFKLGYKGKDNKLTLEKFQILDSKNNKEGLEVVGDINLNNFEYNLDILSKDMLITNFLDEKDSYIEGKFKGNLKGEQDKFLLDLKIDSLSAKYIGDIQNLKGKLVLDNRKKFQLDFDGEIGNLGYNEYNFGGLLTVIRMKDSILEIKSFQNKLIDLVGKLDFSKNDIDMRAKIKDLTLEKFGVEKPKIVLEDIEGELKGKLNSPNGYLKINSLNIEVVKDEVIEIKGGLKYSEGKIFTDNFKINNSYIDGKYILKTGEYNGKINLIEENIGRYYNDTNLKYRVIGTLFFKGIKQDIEADLKATVDKIYLVGNHLPNIYTEIEYKSKNLSDGIVKIKDLTLSNSNLENLLTITGEYNILEKKLNTTIKKQVLPLKKLREYIPLESLEGNLEVAGNFGGSLDNLKYNLDIESKNISISGVTFDKNRVYLVGDLNKLILKEFSFRYLDNLFFSRGEYDIKEKKYSYYANSQKINLSFLNVFLEKYGINSIKGEATFNLILKDDGNDGYLTIKNFNIENKDLFLKLERFNSTIKLAKNNLYIENFKGILNGGEASADGYIQIPTIKELENPYYKENLKYKAELNLKNIQYKYGNYFNVDFNTDITFQNNFLNGQFEIIRGKVLEIPNNSKSLFQRVKEFIFKSASNTVNQSEDLGSDFKIETVFENAVDLNLGLKIDEGVDLDIQMLNSFVTDIKGKVIGNGTLSGQDGKYTFIGNTEILGGSLNVNDNIFYLDRALVVFNDKRVYLPKINPNLLIDARVDVQDEQLGLSLNGELDKLQFTISSKKGTSSGNLNSLLIDGDNENEENNGATTTLITNVIGGQVTQILRPVSNLVRNTLNISKFRISSNFLTEDSKNTNTQETQNRIRLGAVLEAEDNIYKDKIWWVASGTLLEEDNRENENHSKNNSGAFKEYDFSIEYRFDLTKSIGIGVGKLPEETKKSDNKESKGDLNYHIDFKFEKKYDNLIDIFINK